MSNGTESLVPAPPDPSEFDGQSVVPVVVVTMVISIIFVSMRVWSRAVILHVVGLEDWFILIALIFALATSVSMAVQLKYGLGHHAIYVDLDGITGYFKTALVTSIVYALGLMFAKLSILCLYIRILTYERVRLAAKVLLGVVVISHLWIIAALLTICVPLDAFWDLPKRATAYCHPLSVFWSHAGLNITTDFLIFILPLTVLRKLQIPKRQLVALYLVFLIAFCVCIISIIRCVLLAQATVSPNPDLTWDAVSTANWTMVEVHAAIVCACLPTVKPILERMFPRLLSSPRSYQSPSEGGAVGTIGHTRRNRPGPCTLGGDVSVATVKSADLTTTESESVGMENLEAQDNRVSPTGEIVVLDEHPVATQGQRTRSAGTEDDSLTGQAVAGHSAL